jgi:hypothetical protein
MLSDAALITYTENILDRLAGTLELEAQESMLLAAAIHDGFTQGLSIDEFFQWQESGKQIEDFINMPNDYSYLVAWREAAVAEDPNGVICGRCKRDNTWYDSEGWFYWWPADATGKPDGMPPVAICRPCCKDVGVATTRGTTWKK